LPKQTLPKFGVGCPVKLCAARNRREKSFAEINEITPCASHLVLAAFGMKTIQRWWQNHRGAWALGAESQAATVPQPFGYDGWDLPLSSMAIQSFLGINFVS